MWNDLELSDKARMIKLAVKSGIKDLRTIQEVYNKFEDGGYKPNLLSFNPYDSTREYRSAIQPPYKVTDLSGIETTRNRPYNPMYIEYINDGLEKRGIDKERRAAIIGNIIEESGGDPYADSKTGFKGLLQWEESRYWPTSEGTPFAEIDKQLDYIKKTTEERDTKKSWTHGGKGSGFNSAKQAYNSYTNSSNLEDIMNAFTLGYVRPTGKSSSVDNRLKVATQVHKKLVK